MKNDAKELLVNLNKYPNVLFIGNGMLKLDNHGMGWGELLEAIKKLPGIIDVEGIPYAMQPEALSGYDVEDIQRRIAEKIETLKVVHPLLVELLEIKFDAIITTNYTYEIEMVLSGNKWSENKRKNSFSALDGKPHARHNTFTCNIVDTPDGRSVPVFHIHGEKARKHSMVLSYYSYAKSVFELNNYNKNKLLNKLEELQADDKSKKCECWLDYFIMGNIYAVGFGFDVSEFDVWWAVERKAREHAAHGKLKAYIEKRTNNNIHKALFNALDAESKFVRIDDNGYADMYKLIIEDIKECIIN